MYFDVKGIIISGIAAGILVGIMSLAGCCCWIVDIAAMLGAGALTIYLSKGRLAEQNELLANGAAAGFVAGLAGGILYAVITTLLNAIFPALLGSEYLKNYYSAFGTTAPTVLSSSIMGFVCCLPAMVVSGTILGALGALLYHSMNKQPPVAGMVQP